jgi:RNA polymerase sigma-70 factor (ECF subfamily)
VPAATISDPVVRYDALESVSFAFLLALEVLGPKHRAVLLLRDVFGYTARETADMLAMSEANVRVVLHRARNAMREYDTTRQQAAPARHEAAQRALAEFLGCLVAQDSRGLERLLAESVTTITDGGGEYNALRAPLAGKSSVIKFHLRIAQRRGARVRFEPCMANGSPAVRIVFADGKKKAAPTAVLRCELDADGRIARVHTVLATRKLTAAGFGRDCAPV